MVRLPLKSGSGMAQGCLVESCDDRSDSLDESSSPSVMEVISLLSEPSALISAILLACSSVLTIDIDGKSDDSVMSLIMVLGRGDFEYDFIFLPVSTY